MNEKRDEIAKTITELVKTELGWVNPIPKGTLADQLDSMQLLSLSVAIEDHYEICFEPEEEEQIQTFQDLISLIVDKTGGIDDLHDHS